MKQSPSKTNQAQATKPKRKQVPNQMDFIDSYESKVTHRHLCPRYAEYQRLYPNEPLPDHAYHSIQNSSPKKINKGLKTNRFANEWKDNETHGGEKRAIDAAMKRHVPTKCPVNS